MNLNIKKPHKLLFQARVADSSAQRLSAKKWNPQSTTAAAQHQRVLDACTATKRCPGQRHFGIYEVSTRRKSTTDSACTNLQSKSTLSGHALLDILKGYLEAHKRGARHG